MLNLLKCEANRTRTENDAETYVSTQSDCLDLFASIGALRHAENGEIIHRFLRAWTENPDLAVKTLFFARDIRGGLGERKVFRVILQWLARNHPGTVKKNISYVAEYGRFDDLLSLMDTPCEKAAADFIARRLKEDLENLENGSEVSLLAKWLPSVNASSLKTVRCARRIAAALGMTEVQYRKTLVKLRARIRILENHLREKDYSFDYSKQPSRAMLKYRKAFWRNDGERYGEFLAKAERGEVMLHAETLYPYEFVEPYLKFENYAAENASFMRSVTEEERRMLNATWSALPNFCKDENALAVVDTSGSMYWTGSPMPAAVALSLGLYFAERNKGAFANHFVEFSSQPQLIEIKGETFCDRLRYIASFNTVANTDLKKVFDLILETAVKNQVPQEELPQKLYIISDMEFDACICGADITNFEYAKKRFAAHGYALPEIVFWNVQSRNRQQPVTMDERGVALVSGASPRVFSMLQSGILSPYGFMLEVLGSQRYAPIAA